MWHTGSRYLNNSKPCGFTLAELLIALAILGIVATFTIPKVLNSQANNANKSAAKEAAGMVSEAYQTYIRENGYSTSLKMSDLTPYLNYVSFRTIGSFDLNSCTGVLNCSTTSFCLNLHNGGLLHMDNVISFGSTDTTAGLRFAFDPDGVTSSVKGVPFFIYYNGLLRTRETMQPNTANSSTGDHDPQAGCDPTWFNWN